MNTQNAQRFILYIERGCPYCASVMHTMSTLGMTADKDVQLIDRDTGNNTQELVSRGGKRQVPYLVDTQTGIEMYESADINHYLREHVEQGGE